MEAKQKPFNKYSLQEAYELLHLSNPIAWEISFEPIEPSAFFHEELRRMEAFDLKSSERGKEILIDAILKEALTRQNLLKVWKEIPLKTEELNGRSEYVIAKRQLFPKQYALYLANAPKDDFEKGLAQCLLGMKACQLLNAKANIKIDMHGIVS